MQGNRVQEKLPILNIFNDKVSLELTALPEEGWPRITKSPSVFPVIVQHKPGNGVDHDYDEVGWGRIDIMDLR